MTEIKELWPGWKTGKLIGQGSFGRVYEIYRDMFGRREKAALKVISIPQNKQEIEEMRCQGYDEESISLRFEDQMKGIVKEYMLMAGLKGNTNIVYCDDIKCEPHTDGPGWDILIKMELLTPMTRFHSRQIREQDVIKAGKDLCQALILCRSKKIVHRDIKPQNVFASEEGNYKLGDFGIARNMEGTTDATLAGSYNYMAPEVYHGKPYGPSADIYSLGLVLYCMLNRKTLPFLPLPPEIYTTNQEKQARDRRFSGEPLPPPADGSKELKRIVLKACAFEPKDRYSDPEEMKRELEKLLSKQKPDNDKDKTVMEPKTVLDPDEDHEELTQLRKQTETVIQPVRGRTERQTNGDQSPGQKRKVLLATAAAMCLLCLAIGIWESRDRMPDTSESNQAAMDTQESGKSILVTENNQEFTERETIQEEPSRNFAYDILADGTVTITGYTGSASKLQIPAELDGHPVTGIGDAAFVDCDSLTQVIIPEGVTSIGFFAFERCDSLQQVTIPESMSTIGQFAFLECYGLTEISIPEGVTDIGKGVFSGCRSLTELSIPDGITTIGESTFSECYSLVEITIPESVTYIGPTAFDSCENLMSITIPENVTFIGAWAFEMCYSLEEVYYTGSEDQWQQIQFVDGNDLLMNAQIHYNS